jgi:hypothetical protein
MRLGQHPCNHGGFDCIAGNACAEIFQMPDRVTVRLPPELSRALKATSQRMQRKNSEIVRMALGQFLQDGSTGGSRPADRVQALLGSLKSGLPDSPETSRVHPRVSEAWRVSCCSIPGSFRAAIEYGRQDG